MKVKLCTLVLLVFFIMPQSIWAVQGHLPLAKAGDRIESPSISNKSIKLTDVKTQRLVLGWKFYSKGNYQKAIELFLAARKAPQTRLDATLGLSYCYMAMGRDMMALPLLKELIASNYRRQEAARAIITILMRQEKYDEIPPFLNYVPLPLRKSLVKRIQIKKLRRKAVDLVSTGKSRRAFELLLNSISIKGMPWNETIGILYDASKLAKNDGEAEKLLSVLDRLRKREDIPKRFQSDLENIKKAAGWTLEKWAWQNYKQKRFVKAESIFRTLLDHDINKPEIFYGLALCSYELGNFQECKARLRRYLGRPKFRKLFCKCHSQMINSLVEKDQLDEALKILEGRDSLKCDTHNSMRESLSRKLYEKGMTLFAAQIQSQGTDPFSGLDSPSLGLLACYRRKTGEKGTSFLEEFRVPGVRLLWPIKGNHAIGFSLYHLHLDSGNIGESPWLGSPTLGSEAIGAQPKSKVTANVPVFTYIFDGKTDVIATISETPDTGIISPKPTAKIDIGTNKGLRVSLFQDSVKQSILSFTGQIDPYTNERWGRVVKRGFGIKYSFDLLPPFWMTVGGEYARYKGEKTQDNQSLKSDLSVGFTRNLNQDINLSAGLFFYYMHFSKNTNFYTMGHGGYFSPDSFFGAGPFLNVHTPFEKRWIFDINASINYIYYKEESAPFYPLKSGSTGIYPGESSNRALGYWTKTRLFTLVGSHWLFSVEGSINHSNDFTESTVLLHLDFFFKKRSGIVKFDTIRP